MITTETQTSTHVVLPRHEMHEQSSPTSLALLMSGAEQERPDISGMTPRAWEQEDAADWPENGQWEQRYGAEIHCHLMTSRQPMY